MSLDKAQQRSWLSWASVGVLAVLCALLGLLQNHWIAQLSLAEKERLQQQLQSDLNRLSRDFNNEIASASSGLLPSAVEVESLGTEKAYSDRYAQWKEAHDRTMFKRIALVERHGDALALLIPDQQTGQFVAAEWPSDWSAIRERMTPPWNRRFEERAPGPSTVIELVRFPHPPDHEGPGHGPGEMGPGPREQDFLEVELNLDYVRGVMLPEVLRRHLGASGKLEYEAEVIDSADPSLVIFRSQANSGDRVSKSPDGSVGLLNVSFMNSSHQHGRGPDDAFRRMPPPPGFEPPGRWRLLVRHEAGSLEQVVARAKWQNLATSAGLLVLILATVATLVRLSRRAQHLAELQMNFVAGVSHELRTPLTVIRTAAYNLRGKVSSNPGQVERYGRLIEDESQKLGALVEQVLRFAGARAGHVIQKREPVNVEKLIDEGLSSSGAALPGAVTVEKKIDPDLPPVFADELAMKFALQNLVDNALKYGTEGGNWIGVFASRAAGNGNGAAVEVRVADHGPGIPADEQDHVFDPFFRGRRAVQDQVHGTGLGLSLVKKIVEAHGGTISVHSEPAKGTEFILRIPAAVTDSTA